MIDRLLKAARGGTPASGLHALALPSDQVLAHDHHR
jgi:hypothetical protein